MLTTADDTLAGYSGADFRRLSAAAACDKIGKHQLVESPEQADIILFVGSTYPDHRDVRSHPFLRSYREKCFMFHSDDYVIPFLPGVYVNIAKRWHSDRTATGSYLQLTQWDYVPHIPSLADCKYLFCFVGSTRTHTVRRRLMRLKHPRGYLEDTSELISASERNKAFVMVDYQNDTKTHYGEIISRSKFVLCPRGYACSTWRLYETMKAGRIPVIISDQWVPPKGPAWETFSIRVAQNKISRIPALLEQYEAQSEAMGRRARVAFEEWFSKETVFHRIVEWCLILQCSSGRSKVGDLVPYIQLLRPFYIRHVLLPEAKRFIRDRADAIHRLRQKRSSQVRNP
jgi:Exostosin family